jgi:hypothetical protein
MITVLLIVAVVSSPFVYAIVEPHIKITMDDSQTTKPIQVVDSFGQEVFSVDVDGTIFPEPVSTPFVLNQTLQDFDSGMSVLLFEQIEEFSVETSIPSFDFDAMEEIALWRIDFSSSNDDTNDPPNTGMPDVYMADGYFSGFTKSSNGAEVGLYIGWKNTSNPSWDFIGTAGRDATTYSGFGIGGSFLEDFTMCFRDAGDFDPCFISIRLGNTDAGGGGIPMTNFIKDVKYFQTVVLPASATLTRVI